MMLNNPFQLGYVMPDYNRGIDKPWNTANQAEEDCLVYFCGVVQLYSSPQFYISSDGENWTKMYTMPGGVGTQDNFVYPIPKGWFYKIENGTKTFLNEYPLQGA